MFNYSSSYLKDLVLEIEKAEMSPSLSGSCLSTVPPFPRTKAVDSSCPEEAGRAMLSYECPSRCGQKQSSSVELTQCNERPGTDHVISGPMHCVSSTEELRFLTASAGTLVRKHGPACFLRAGRVDSFCSREGRNSRQATAGQRRAQTHLSFLYFR